MTDEELRRIGYTGHHEGEYILNGDVRGGVWISPQEEYRRDQERWEEQAEYERLRRETNMRIQRDRIEEQSRQYVIDTDTREYYRRLEEVRYYGTDLSDEQIWKLRIFISEVEKGYVGRYIPWYEKKGILSSLKYKLEEAEKKSFERKENERKNKIEQYRAAWRKKGFLYRIMHRKLSPERDDVEELYSEELDERIQALRGRR